MLKTHDASRRFPRSPEAATRCGIVWVVTRVGGSVAFALGALALGLAIWGLLASRADIAVPRAVESVEPPPEPTADAAPTSHALRDQLASEPPLPPEPEAATGAPSLRGTVLDEHGTPVVGALLAPGRLGAVHPRYDEARSVRTDREGRFALGGVPPGDRFVVLMDGYVDIERRMPDAPAEIVITLRPTLGIRGFVVGAAGPAETAWVELRADQDGDRPPDYAWRVLGERHPVAADGSFAVGGLGPGDYVARAWIEGWGSSRAVSFRLPGEASITLPIVPDVVLDVRAVDDLGDPIAGARIALERDIVGNDTLRDRDTHGQAGWILRSPDGEATTSELGRASLRVAPFAPLALAANATGHVPTARILDRAPAKGEPVVLTLVRGGQIRARLEDPNELRRFDVKLRLWPAHLRLRDAWRSRTVFYPAEDGEFASECLAPGAYRVALEREDRTGQHASPDSGAMPLLGRGIDRTSERVVEVRAGETLELTFPAVTLGEVHGLVVLRGAPAPGVAVFAVRTGQWEFVDGADSHTSLPHAISDERGRFAMAYSRRGRWTLRARHPLSSYPSEPTTVELGAPPGRQEVTIHLPTSTMRGGCDLSHVAEGDRRFVTAILFRPEVAAKDPFLSLDRALHRDALDDGAFAFDMLPVGRWLLRISDRRDRILLQKLVAVETGGSTVDLGQLDIRHTRVPARIGVRDPKVDGAWLRRLLPGLEDGAFQEIARVREGVLDFGTVPPGRYAVQGFRAYRVGGNPRLTGEATTDRIPVTVRADGTVEPAEIF